LSSIKQRAPQLLLHSSRTAWALAHRHPVQVTGYVLQARWTPLHEASHAGNLPAMRTLLDAGADIEARVVVRAGACEPVS
jgi:hypothetical protein